MSEFDDEIEYLKYHEDIFPEEHEPFEDVFKKSFYCDEDFANICDWCRRLTYCNILSELKEA